MIRTSFWSIWTKQAMWMSFLMGFSSGLPLLLSWKTLQAWMTTVNVDLKTVGSVATVFLPYSLKFLWAPLLDRYSIKKFGRRRTWLLISQLSLVFCLIGMAVTDPASQTFHMVLWAFALCFFSATQDIVVDAYRRETLNDNELGLGSSVYIYGYRIAMWFSGGLALILAQRLGWQTTYLIMAALMASSLMVSYWAKEPEVHSQPANIRQAVVEPFIEFFSRKGAILILIFILLYKLGDQIAGNLLNPFYLKMGYSLDEIAIVTKTFSLPFVMLGALVGGIIVERFGILRSLVYFGVLQAISTVCFSFLTNVGHNLWILGSVIYFEDFATSAASSAFVAFMGSKTNKQFTATQYALLSSLTKLPHFTIASGAGYYQEALGWNWFFYLCTLIAAPGMLLIYWLAKLEKPKLGSSTNTA